MHTVKVTGANVHDVTMTSELLTGEENEVYGDSGYIGADKREEALIRNNKGRKIKYKLIENHRKLKSYLQADSMPLRNRNIKNLQFGQRSNTSLLL